MQAITTIGLDIAKSVFQVHGVDADGHVVVRRQSAEGLSRLGRSEMRDYSLHSVKSRPAKVGDKLTTRDFGTGTVGFAASEDMNIAVCVLPGTELSFADEVRCLPTGLIAWRDKVIDHKTAIFRQINKDKVAAHHDA